MFQRLRKPTMQTDISPCERLRTDIEQGNLPPLFTPSPEEIEEFQRRTRAVAAHSYGQPRTRFEEEEQKRMRESNLKIPAEIGIWVERVIAEKASDLPHGYLSCHAYWAMEEMLFQSQGYEWYSPKTMFPHTHFD